ncbi:MAG: response regulator transcription factor [Bacteroidota bacterium]|nr:response regulator transcription factor [Bacteroidota bacterium]
MTCIAIDDEPLALKLLVDNISKVPWLTRVDSCRSALQALKVLQDHPVDLLFVDIQMPGLTGLQFIATLPGNPLVIFITAYREFALESYDLQVVDYLVKPVSLERFIKACNRARDLHELRAGRGISRQTPEYFFLSADYSQVKILFRDILWMEGVRDYVKFYMKGTAHPQLFRASLKAIELELPSGRFLRIHKSYIVAIDSITSVRKSSVFMGDRELPVGDTYREAVENLVHKK